MRKGTWMVVMFLGWLFGPPSNVQKAGEAYQAKRYQEAVGLFAGELPNYPGQQSGLNFNQAQCWMLMDSNARAMSLFGNCTQAYAENRQVASWSWNQIGTLFASGKGPKPQQAGGSQPGAAGPGMQPGMNPMMGGGPGASQNQTVSREELTMALQAFKDALKLDHDNEVARYNYELVKRKLQQQDQNQDQNQDQQQQQQDQQQQQQQQQNQQNKPKPQPQENNGNQQQQQQGEGKDPMEMSMEEAERILAAMNSNEKKFLQQLERSKKHKTYNDDGPNW